MMYLVKYKGMFGFLKPWTAVRDSLTYSQQFLTPSVVTGIERKLFPELLEDDNGEIQKIIGHRLSYKAISEQQEQILSKGWNRKRDKEVGNYSYKEPSILVRGILVEPVLWLAFSNREDAEVASSQSICLCRNEDMMFPENEIVEANDDEFLQNEELFNGFELVFEKSEESFMVGYNRFKGYEPMYGTLRIVGNPVNDYYER